MKKLPPLKIGKITVRPPLVLAPMEGVNDAAFRSLCRKHGAGMTYSEMISVESFLRDSRGAIERAGRQRNDRPHAIQLFGISPKRLAEAAKTIEDQKLAEIIDLNAGCPAPNITQLGAGAALLQKPKQLCKIVEAMTSSVSLPITVKVRAGWRDSRNFLKTIKAIQEAGAPAIAIHPRTALQGYSGKAEWTLIKKAVEVLEIPVIGNGDVWTPEDALKMLKETDCSAVMIGRAAASNPRIFEEITRLASGKKPIEKTWNNCAALFNEYLQLATEQPKEQGMPTFQYVKIHAQSLSHALPGSAEARQQIARAKTVQEIVEIFNSRTEK